MYSDLSAVNPTDGPTNIVDYLDWKWKTNERYTRDRLRDYFDNIAFYLDHQHQYFSTNDDTYSPRPLEGVATGKVYSVTNLIKPLVDTRINKILGDRPVLDVSSEEKTSEAILKAENNTKILRALWLDLNMQSILTHVIKWSVITNHCFLRPYYNPEYGKHVPNPQYDETMAEATKLAGYDYDVEQNISVGRIACDIFNPMQTIFDTSKPTWRDVMRYGWVEFKYLKNIEDLRNIYGKDKCNGIEPEAEGSICSVEEQLLNLNKTGSVESRKSDNRFKDNKAVNVSVYEYYEAPSHKFPNGLHAVKCQDNKLYDSRDTDEKLPTGRIPVIMVADQVGMETLWSKSLVSGSLNKQKQYNILKGRMIEHARLPSVYAFSEDSAIDVENLPAKSYIICKYDEQSGPPMIVSPPPYPETNRIVMEEIKMELEHYWGEHEVNVRPQPSPKVSGRARFLSMQQDVSRLSTTLAMFSESLSDFGEILLWLAKENYDTKRSGHYKGKAGNMETIEFTGSQDILQEYTVRVTVGSEFQRNRQALMQFTLDLLGVIGNIPAIASTLNDKMVFHKLLSFINEEFANILMLKNQDAGEAEWENRELLAGKNPKVQPWHTHPVHVQILTSLLTSQEFRDLPEERQNEIVKTHLSPHLQFLQQAMKKQQDMAAQAKHGIPSEEQPAGGGRFQQASEAPTGVNAVDAQLERIVQPKLGAYGAESTP